MIGNKSLLIDSNILIISSNKDEPKYFAAIEFRKETQNKSTAYIAHQNIFETIRILTHPKFPNPMTVSEVIAQIEVFQSFYKVIYPRYDTATLALKLIEKYNLTSNKIFDAYLAATMLTNGIKHIATLNVKDFDYMEELEVIKPF